MSTGRLAIAYYNGVHCGNPVLASGIAAMNENMKATFTLRPFGSFTFTTTEGPITDQPASNVKSAPYVFPTGTVLPTPSDGVDFV